jgi:polyisoprenoid-binding protein YceI
MKKITLCLLLVFSTFSFVFAADFALKPSKSSVTAIACCHAFTKKVEIRFEKFSGTLSYDSEQKKILNVSAKIQADSLDSKSKRRDKHLRAKDFFDVENHAEITFQSVSVGVSGQEFLLKGVLTMKGVSEEIELQGVVVSSSSNEVELQASGEINSKNFGVGTSKQKDLVELKISGFFEKI